MNGIIIPLINISENYNPIKTELGTTTSWMMWHSSTPDSLNMEVQWKTTILEIIIIFISQGEWWIFTKDF